MPEVMPAWQHLNGPVAVCLFERGTRLPASAGQPHAPARSRLPSTVCFFAMFNTADVRQEHSGEDLWWPTASAVQECYLRKRKKANKSGLPLPAMVHAFHEPHERSPCGQSAKEQLSVTQGIEGKVGSRMSHQMKTTLDFWKDAYEHMVEECCVSRSSTKHCATALITAIILETALVF
jgi:hypothetical protein